MFGYQYSSLPETESYFERAQSQTNLMLTNSKEGYAEI